MYFWLWRIDILQERTKIKLIGCKWFCNRCAKIKNNCITFVNKFYGLSEM